MRFSVTMSLALALGLMASLAEAQAPDPQLDVPETPKASDPPPEVPASAQTGANAPAPFGSRLFMGNFVKQRDDGLNPDYVIAPGDRVTVNTWGAVEISDVFIVDAQGNIFLPQIGPIQLAGVRNAELTDVVRKSIRDVYARNVDVYTNLLTAAPVSVYVTGQVLRPGRYAGIPSDPILYFLDQAGGIDPQAGSFRNIKVLREGKALAEIDLYAFLLEGVIPTVQLADGDTVLVEPRGPIVTVEGDVANPTVIEFQSDVFHGSDALDIVRKAALATDVTVRGMRGERATAHTLSVEEFAELRLHDGDVVSVRRDGRHDAMLITLEGEFEGHSMVSVRSGARLVDVLNYVPVRRDLANTEAVHIKRVSVARAQKRAIDDSLFRLEKTALLTLSQSNGEADIRLKEAELMQQFIQSARLIQPLGRVVTSTENGQANALLEDGDIIVIPRKTNVIRVGGEVQMTQAVLYEPDWTAEDYVARAGGFSDRADEDRILVLHADASVSVGDGDTAIKPGDELLVTPRVDSKRLQNTMDVVQIVYQIAVAAGVAIAPVLSALNN